MEALASRPEGWTYSILKEPCVQDRFDSSGADSPRQVTESSNIAVQLQAKVSQENFFGVTFRSISAVDLLIYDFSVHIVLTNYTPSCATVDLLVRLIE